ncbi:MAG TPA: NUDIX hydrolase [Candidatus Baltobacteraceae bacterium]
MSDSEKDPEVVATRRVFAGRVFDVRCDQIRWGDGQTASLDIVEHGDSVAIVAVTTAGELLLVRQYRRAASAFLWEVPAGCVEPGETPVEGAHRELAEETGFRAGRLRSLGGCWVTPGYCDEFLHFVLAEDLLSGSQDLDEDERITVAAVSPSNARQMVARGEICDAKTLLAIAWLHGDRLQLLGAPSDNSDSGPAAS